jgi:hypothetical protein
VVYEYPREDACLFKKFPHERMVIPIIESGYEAPLSCTCTIAWLELYIPRYGSIFDFTNASKIFDENYEETNQILFGKLSLFKYCDKKRVAELECDFKAMFDNCDIATFNKVI